MLAPYVRTGFCNGVAEVGEDAFPLPPFVAHRLASVLEVATDYDGPPAPMLEAARTTGKRAGILATQAKRRLELDQRWAVKTQPLWREIADYAAPELARQLQPQESEKTPRQIVDAVLANLPRSVTALWQKLTGRAMREGGAQGAAIAQMWIAAADDSIAVMPSYDLAFQAAMDAMARLGEYPAWIDAEGWQAKQLEGMAYQLGQKLSNAMANGMSGTDMLGLVDDAITGDSSYALMMFDSAISIASIRGASDLYASEGVALVDWLTADDPCQLCEDNAQNGPYAPMDVPDPPHPFCRCGTAAVGGPLLTPMSDDL